MFESFGSLSCSSFTSKLSNCSLLGFPNSTSTTVGLLQYKITKLQNTEQQIRTSIRDLKNNSGVLKSTYVMNLFFTGDEYNRLKIFLEEMPYKIIEITHENKLICGVLKT